MSFNIFGQTTENDIRVGYIDPNLGYVEGLTICEANEHAKNNPGTTFIFRDGGNNIRYVNINEINRLSAFDLTPSNEKCGGIQDYSDCSPPSIQFFGGGGIGAVGNPIIGRDGSLLAVDLVSGGHGYQYPPKVVLQDSCQIGNGVVLTAILGKTVDQIEVYEGEEDYEEYEICDDIEVGYGSKYGANGQILGNWEPNLYTKIGADPIKREIELFQKAVKNPFWTTRFGPPDRVTVLGSTFATQEITNVGDVRWGEFMNKYAISPVKPSDTTGTDEAGKIFTLEWELNFPVSGNYIFRGVCDNIGQLFVDNALVGNLGGFDKNPSPLQKSIQEGNHIVRVDLLNAPVVEKVNIVTETESTVDVTFKITGRGRNTNLMKFSFVSGGYSFTLKGNDRSGDSRSVTVKLNPNAKFKVFGSSSKGDVEQGIVKNGTKDKEGGSGESNTIFADHIESDNDNDDLQISASTGSFKASGKSQTGGRSTYDLTFSPGGGGATSTTSVEGEVVSPKSFNENPMGVSMVIDAPTPPIPQEPLPIPEGECPPNPIWSTRFPGASQQWYPVRFPNAWSSFMNRYAISPVLPTNSPGSDLAGATFSNSWQVNLPYAGYYGVKGTKDNGGRLLIDGQQISNLNGFARNNPDLTKVYLTKGAHTITVEVSNNPVQLDSVIDKKIFSTQDWRVPATEEETTSDSKLKPSFVLQGSNVYLQVDGVGSGKITFDMKVDDNPSFAGIAGREIVIPSDEGSVRLQRNPYTEYDNDRATGKFKAGKKYGPIQILGAGPSARGPILNSKNRLGLRDADGDGENIRITIAETKSDKSTTTTTTATSQSPTKNGVTYDGPKLFGHTETRWSQFMNDFSVSPKVFKSIGQEDPAVVGKYTLAWKNVNFPESGTYKFNFQADNIAKLKIGGVDIFETSDFAGNKVQYTFNLTAGDYDIEVELENLQSAQEEERRKLKNRNKNKKKKDKGGKDDFIFTKNPMGVALFISKDIIFSESNKTPWTTNPVGISAILIPPPCAKRIGGKGVVTDVVVAEPGNGYPQSPSPGYPVVLVLDRIEIENPGINYKETDVIKITPDNGAVLEPVFGPFGQIVGVNVLKPGSGFTVYPSIEVIPSVSEPGTSGTPTTGTFGTPTGTGSGSPTTGTFGTPTGTGSGSPTTGTTGTFGTPTGTGSGSPTTGTTGTFGTPTGTGSGSPTTGTFGTPTGTGSGSPTTGTFGTPTGTGSGSPTTGTIGTFGTPTGTGSGSPTTGVSRALPPSTGVNAKFRPVFRVVRDPVQLLEDQQVKQEELIQVTDLVGLKQTGYVDGRAYFGAVYYDEGIPYAGYYKTAGTQVRVYNTLQESITGEVTTRPSAIQRSGTDIRSNDPRLNIPRTPQSTTEQ